MLQGYRRYLQGAAHLVFPATQLNAVVAPTHQRALDGHCLGGQHSPQLIGVVARVPEPVKNAPVSAPGVFSLQLQT